MVASQISCDGTTFTAPLIVDEVPLLLSMYVTESDAIRLKIDEKIPRWTVRLGNVVSNFLASTCFGREWH